METRVSSPNQLHYGAKAYWAEASVERAHAALLAQSHSLSLGLSHTPPTPCARRPCRFKLVADGGEELGIERLEGRHGNATPALPVGRRS